MKRGAISLSITTMIIMVVGVIMLVMALVFVRKLMCSGIALTGDLNQIIQNELNKISETAGGEVVCIGSGENPAPLLPSNVRKNNILWCRINAEESAKYTFVAEIASSDPETLKNKVKIWSVLGGGSEITRSIKPGDESPKKLFFVKVSSTAPRGTLTILLKYKKEGETEWNEEILNFEVRRAGWLQATMC